MTTPYVAPQPQSSDVTIGEVWRGQSAIRTELATISSEVRALPAALAKEVDDRSRAHVDTLRTEINLRLAPMEVRVARIERIVWGVIGFVFVGNGAAILALILKK